MTTSDQSAPRETTKPAAQSTKHPGVRLPKELQDALAVLTPGMNHRDLGEKLGYSLGEARTIWDELRRRGLLYTSGQAGTPAARPDLHPVPYPAQKGFFERPRKGGKSYWDWLDLSIRIIGAIAIPLTVIGLILNVNQFNTQQSASAQMQATQVAASAAQLLDQQRQTILDTYLDRMSDLLLTYHLSAPNSGVEIRALAQARTYTALRNLDGTRKGTLVRFLWGAGLINGLHPIISLYKADLSGAVFTDAILSGANLSGAILSGAILSGANLIGVDFTEANLSNADLLYTDLQNAQMDSADLSGAYVYWFYVNPLGSYGGGGDCGGSVGCADSFSQVVGGAVNKDKAHLYVSRILGNYELAGQDDGLVGQDLSGAPLEGADLSYRNLSGANLSGANLSGADLSGADLSGADLSGAENLTQQQLDNADSCLDATLPSGLTCHRTPSLRTLSLIDLLKYLVALAFAACIGYFIWTRGLPLLARRRSRSNSREHS